MTDQERTAACLAVGSELLGEEKLDRNSLTVTRALAGYGIAVTEKRIVGDDVDRIAFAIRELVAGHDLVVVTGGLGPTADDVTRDAVATALDRPIIHSDEVENLIRARYAAHGRAMPVYGPAMARVVEGSRVLPNTRGTAPGMLFDLRGRVLAVLPGPPWEMREMLERDLLPELVLWNPGAVRVSRTLVLGGVFESDVEESVRHLYERFGRENI